MALAQEASKTNYSFVFRNLLAGGKYKWKFFNKLKDL